MYTTTCGMTKAYWRMAFVAIPVQNWCRSTEVEATLVRRSLPPGKLPSDKIRKACWKIRINPLTETKLGMSQALCDHWKGTGTAMAKNSGIPFQTPKLKCTWWCASPTFSDGSSPGILPVWFCIMWIIEGRYIHTYLLARSLGAFQTQMDKAQWIKTRPQHRELLYSLR